MLFCDLLVLFLRFAGALFVICWCSFCDMLVLFCSASFPACAFILCVSGAFFDARAQMGSCSFCDFLVFFSLGSFLDGAFFLCLSGVFLVLWLVLLFI